VSDHLEILYDVDVEARTLASELGIAFNRTDSLNDDPAFIEVIRGVVLDAVGELGETSSPTARLQRGE
ncbi:MAG TPA: ferrochelatase, partial [Acidimicrobiales bacterium]|nr:ferrochelatase [Acidimicrobiales bacterium]